jgi:REP element-mobilizing transposase RayT
MPTNSNLPNRRSIRLKNYDYSQNGSYFITIVTQNRKHLFGKIEDERMILSSVGRIVEDEWRNTVEIRPNVILGEFIIMPDHMHMIVTITTKVEAEKKDNEEWIHSNPKSPSHTIGAIIRGFKGACTKKINLFLNSSGESRTGELLFAPSRESPSAPSTGESPFAPSQELLSAPSTGESPFAPSQEFPFAPSRESPFASNKIFQRDYYDHIIRNQGEYHRIEKYIIDNPKNWKNWKKKKLKLKSKD